MMTNVKDMTREEQDHILSLAQKIKTEREKEGMFESLLEAKNIMIRWDTSYGKYKQSYYSVAVTVDEVRDLVNEKIFGEAKE